MRLDEIDRTRKVDTSIFLIHVREAHRADGWQTPQNLYEAVIRAAPAADARAGIGDARNPDIRKQHTASAG